MRKSAKKVRTTKNVGRTTKSVGDGGWSSLFASGTLARLLTVFLTRPEASFYQKELSEATEAGLYAVQRELARLEKTGLVIRTPRGNRVYYRANRSHPAFEDLKRVILKTIGLGDALRAALVPLSARVQVAFVFGSYARGEETAESDIDLFMVGDLSLKEASAALGPIGRDLSREFNPVIYSPQEFRSKGRKGRHFVAEVLEGKKVFVIGDEDDLEGLVG